MVSSHLKSYWIRELYISVGDQFATIVCSLITLIHVIAIGILGATVMPHALFLGSSLATLDRVSSDSLPVPGASETRFPRTRSLKDFLRSLFFVGRLSTEDTPIDRHTRHEFRENNSYPFVKAHLNHGMVDISKYAVVLLVYIVTHREPIAFSLLGVAVPINSA